MCSFTQLSQRTPREVDQPMVKQWTNVQREKYLSTTRQQDIKQLPIRLQNYKLMIFSNIPKVPLAIM
jgi:hypothetical protein